MNKDLKFSIFSDDEEKIYLKTRDFRDKLLDPITSFFASMGVKASWFSFFGFLMVLPFVYFFKFNPWIAFIFILFNLALDAIDGPLARKTARHAGQANLQGSVLDTALDELSFLVIFFTIFYYNIFNPFWGSVYLVNYLLLVFLIIFSRALKIKVFPVLRSRYYFLTVLFLLIFVGVNYFDYFHVLFSVYFAITNLFLFQRIRCSLQ